MIRFVVRLGQSGNRECAAQKQPAFVPLLQTCWDTAIKFRAIWKTDFYHIIPV